MGMPLSHEDGRALCEQRLRPCSTGICDKSGSMSDRYHTGDDVRTHNATFRPECPAVQVRRGVAVPHAYKVLSGRNVLVTVDFTHHEPPLAHAMKV